MNSQPLGLPWLVYGSGAVASRAVGRLATTDSRQVILAGRDPERVRVLAEQTGVSFRVADLSQDVDPLLERIGGVINTAGPFRNTAALLSACVERGINYVDVSNEGPSHAMAWALDAQAREHGAAVVPGAGMGTWFGERLVQELARELDRPSCALLIMVPSGSLEKSSGVHASEKAVLATPGVIFEDGRYRRVRGASRVVHPPEKSGFPSAVLLATGEVFALPRSLGLTRVEVAAAVKAPPLLLRLALPLLTARANLDSRRSRENPRRSSPRETPHPSVSSGEMRVRLIAELTGINGRRLCGTLSSRSGTDVAAYAAIAAMRAVTENGLVGTHTAFQVLGDHPLGQGLDPIIEVGP